MIIGINPTPVFSKNSWIAKLAQTGNRRSGNTLET